FGAGIHARQDLCRQKPLEGAAHEETLISSVRQRAIGRCIERIEPQAPPAPFLQLLKRVVLRRPGVERIGGKKRCACPDCSPAESFGHAPPGPLQIFWRKSFARSSGEIASS